MDGREMKVLGIYGSPRKGGNTELLLEEVLKGAEAEGAEVDRLEACRPPHYPLYGVSRLL